MSVYFTGTPEALQLEYFYPVENFSKCETCGKTSEAGSCLDIEARKLIKGSR